jgi:MFS family permease
VRDKTIAVSAALFCFGTVGGSLVPRMPAFKESLGLTDGRVGLVFVAYAVGAMAGSLVARSLMAHGARRLVRGGTILLLVALVGPALAPNYALFAGSAVLLGIIAGVIDVLENSQAAEIERDAGRPMINAFHGFWSLGFIAGAAGAAAAASLGVAPLPHFAFVAVVVGAASVPLLAGVPDTRGGAATMVPGGTTRLRIGTAVAAVAAVAFLGIVVESAGGDWSPVYLREVGRAGLGFAATAGVVFALAMTAVRFVADRLTARTSPAVMAAAGSVVSAAGIALAIAFPAPPTALLGFLLDGAGCAAIVPLAFSAAANLGRTGTALSIVTGAGYAGTIVGPFVIGTTSDHFGLRTALAIPLVAALAVIGAAASLKPLRAQGRPDGQAGAAERS